MHFGKIYIYKKTSIQKSSVYMKLNISLVIRSIINAIEAEKQDFLYGLILRFATALSEVKFYIRT